MASLMRPDEGGAAVRVPGFAASGGRPSAFAVQDDGSQVRSLAALIEGEIIPRLVIAHAAPIMTEAAPVIGTGITAADVTAMAALALRIEADALLGHVDRILARGATIDGMLIDLLAPTARLLGEYWEEDRCDFLDVTMALWRLQEVVHELSARMPPARLPTAGAYRALFAAMPGDQHSFGTVLIDELFRREGWLTERTGDPETAELLRRAAEGWFDLVGLTISCDGHIEDLPSIIVALRNVSRNPRVVVMVGGRIFTADPALAVKVGADGTARDAKLALARAVSLVRARDRVAGL